MYKRKNEKQCFEILTIRRKSSIIIVKHKNAKENMVYV